MAIRSLVTRGFGNGTFNGTIPLVVLRGYATVFIPSVTFTLTVNGLAAGTLTQNGVAAGSLTQNGVAAGTLTQDGTAAGTLTQDGVAAGTLAVDTNP